MMPASVVDRHMRKSTENSSRTGEIAGMPNQECAEEAPRARAPQWRREPPIAGWTAPRTHPAVSGYPPPRSLARERTRTHLSEKRTVLSCDSGQPRISVFREVACISGAPVIPRPQTPTVRRVGSIKTRPLLPAAPLAPPRPSSRPDEPAAASSGERPLSSRRAIPLIEPMRLRRRSATSTA